MTRNRNKESVFGGCRIKCGMTEGSCDSRTLGGIGTCGMTSSGESGRSMVEMLGVLAIIGVLSIGGIAGYRYAMTKYHANEILNEVRKRAVVASQQRILGQANINLNEFASKINNAYTVTTPDAASGQFALAVGDIPANICEEVKTHPLPIAIGETGGECSGETNTLTFTFANNLGDGTESGEETPKVCDIPCGKDGEKDYCCSEGACVDPNKATLADRCRVVSGCNTYRDCADGQYCDLAASDCEGSDLSGTCMDIGGNIPFTIEGITGNFIQSETPLSSWWASQDWCRAQGKTPLTTARAGCDIESWSCPTFTPFVWGFGEDMVVCGAYYLQSDMLLGSDRSTDSRALCE